MIVGMLLATGAIAAILYLAIQGRPQPTAVAPVDGHMLFAADENLRRRKRKQKVMERTLLAGSSISVLFLAVLLWEVFGNGIGPMLKSHFWTERYTYLNTLKGTAGLLDSLYASAVVLVITLLFAVPVGTAAGIYMEEYTNKGRFFSLVEAAVANLAAVPSIVFGLFGLAVFVGLLQLGASYVAAGLTLGVLILPMLIVSTQEALKNVPQSVRHASHALGATKWQTIRNHTVPYALPGILTGQILALSRAAGETAPLIVLGIPVFQSLLEFGPLGSGSPLQLRAFTLASDAKQEAIALAGGAILLLLLLTLTLNLVAIVVRERLSRKIKW